MTAAFEDNATPYIAAVAHPLTPTHTHSHPFAIIHSPTSPRPPVSLTTTATTAAYMAISIPKSVLLTEPEVRSDIDQENKPHHMSNAERGKCSLREIKQGAWITPVRTMSGLPLHKGMVRNELVQSPPDFHESCKIACANRSRIAAYVVYLHGTDASQMLTTCSAAA